LSAGKDAGPSHWRLYSLILLMTFLWSVNYIFAKIAVREIPAVLAAGIRTLVAVVLILPVYLWQYRKTGNLGWTRADVPLLLRLGALGVALNQALFVAGISQTSVAHAGIMISLTPILVLLIAASVGQESIRAIKLMGMLLALGGVLMLQMAPSKAGSARLMGDFLVFLGALAFAIFTVSGKRVVDKFDKITMTTFAYAGGSLMLLPTTLWYSKSFTYANVSWQAWASVLYMSLFSSVLAYLIYYYALSKIPATRVSAFSYLQPLIATAVAIPALGERPTTSLAFGGSLVLLGVFLAERG
jgi:drug/metabolite transporter (DMT)-like permease